MLRFVMYTIVKNWQIVSVIESGESMGAVLWAICAEDLTNRFCNGDYICTSKIVEIDPEARLVKTYRGSSYYLQGEGIKAEINVKDFELLRQGFSPQQIQQLDFNSNSSNLV